MAAKQRPGQLSVAFLKGGQELLSLINGRLKRGVLPVFSRCGLFSGMKVFYPVETNRPSDPPIDLSELTISGGRQEKVIEPKRQAEIRTLLTCLDTGFHAFEYIRKVFKVVASFGLRRQFPDKKPQVTAYVIKV